MNPIEVRHQLVQTLELDVIGLTNDDAFARALLPEPPTRWYLTGFLVPTEAPAAQNFDETSTDEIDCAAEPGGLDDDTEPEKAAARRSRPPSSIGLSAFVSGGVASLKAAVERGDYAFEGLPGEAEPAAGEQADEGPKDHGAAKDGESEDTEGASNDEQEGVRLL